MFCVVTLKAKSLQSVKSLVVIHQSACRNNPDNLTLQQMSERSSNVDLQEQNTRSRPTNFIHCIPSGLGMVSNVVIKMGFCL